MTAANVKTVKVSEFRNAYDRMYAQANLHYHQCVGTAEVKNWVDIASRTLEQCSNIKCSRATPYDLEQHAKAVQALTDRIEGSGARITILQDREAQKAPQSVVDRTLTKLTIIQGGLTH